MHQESLEGSNAPDLDTRVSRTQQRIRGLLFEEDDPARHGTKRSSKKKGSKKGGSSGPNDDFAWGACADEDLQLIGIECGFVKAPLDYSDPKGRTIELAVSRAVHTDTEDYQGIMLVNPGGPGGSGLLFAILQFFLPTVGGKYDWIGWDPRGAGESIPSFSCGEDYDGFTKPPYTPEYADEWLQKGEDYTQDCYEKHQDLLPHMSSQNYARDMDTIRETLGADTMNFYGYSYGTTIGQIYASMFPDRVGKFVLDGVVPHDRGLYGHNLDQNYSAETLASKWFDWIAQFNSVYGLGRTGSEVRDVFLAARQELVDNPAEGLVGPAEWDETFYRFLSGHDRWISGAQLLSDWINLKNGTRLVESFIPISPNLYAGYLSVTCRDVVGGGWPEYSDAAIDFAQGFEEGASLFTYYNAYFFGAPCYSWHVDPVEPFSVDRNYQHEIMFITLEFDGATPMSGALTARDHFRKSALISVPGAVGHSESLLSGQFCLDQAVAIYLGGGGLPPRNPGRGVADFECFGKPLPDPQIARRRVVEEESEQLQKLREKLIRILDHSGGMG